jgi:hypothetical protein
MNSNSVAKKTVSANTKAKISQSLKNAYSRNESRAKNLGINVKTLRKIKKMHSNVMSELKAAQKLKAATAKKMNANKSKTVKAKTVKTVSANKPKKALANSTRKWLNNVKKVKNTMGITQKEALIIAAQKRKEKGNTKPMRANNTNLLKFNNLPAASPMPTANLLGLNNISTTKPSKYANNLNNIFGIYNKK